MIIERSNSNVEGNFPFNITPRQKDILQGLALGKNDPEIAKSLGLHSATVNFHKLSLIWVGAPEQKRFSAVPVRFVVLSLIQDGLYQGYINPPELPEQSIQLKPWENEIAKAICNGHTANSLSQLEYKGKQIITKEAADQNIKNLRKKFKAKNDYHFAALYTTHEINGFLEIDQPST